MFGFGCITRRAALAGAAAAVFLTPRSAAARARRFGVAVPDSQSRYYGRMLDGMRGAARSLEIELEIEEYSYDPGREASVTHLLLSKGFDGYLLVPLHDHDEIAAQFVAIAKAPTAAVDRRIPGAAVTVVPDLAAAGVIQANIAISLAEPKAAVLYITGSSDLIEQDAVRAFTQKAKESGLEVVVVTATSFSPDEAFNLAAQALVSHPDISVVVAANDVWALGAVAAGERLKRAVQAIGLGDSAKAREALGNKTLTATVDLRPDAQGDTAVRSLATVVNRGICDNDQNPPCPEQTAPPRAILASKE